MSALTIQLPDSLHGQLREIAEARGASVEQLVIAAAGEKLAAILEAADFHGREAALGLRADFESVLAKDSPSTLRTCLRDPIPELFDAARYLDEAVSAHLAGERGLADELIRRADIPAITEWTESLWGVGGPWSRPLPVENRLPFVPTEQRGKVRMPGKADLAALLTRDGFHCRFCGIPLVRAETRELIRKAYPEALRWGKRNADQHAGLQALWLQYDHLLPHARGGGNDLDNMLVTCAPCNNGRSNLTLAEVGLADPRSRAALRSNWDGLERFRF